MKRGLAVILLTGLLTLLAQGQALEEYVKLRKHYRITDAASVAALETFVGSRVVEIRGTVRGMIGDSKGKLLMIENAEGGTFSLHAAEVPSWLQGNAVDARMLIKASRESELSGIEAELLQAIPEPQIAAYELKFASAKKKAAEKAAKSSRKPKPLAGSFPKYANKSWSVSAQEALPYYTSFIYSRNPRLGERGAAKIAAELLGFSLHYGVDARLIVAMILAESGFNPYAKSSAGAEGLGQLMPGTAGGLGISNSYDTEQNLYGTIRLVRGNLELYSKKTGDPFERLVLSLAAYNAGKGAVHKYGGVPPYKQTQNYVKKVVATYRKLAGF